KLAQEIDLPAQAARVVIVRKQIPHLVSEYRYAARLEPNHAHTGADLSAQRVENPVQHPLREIQHAVVVERPPATQRGMRHDHLVSCRLEDLDRGLRRGGMK